MGNGSIVAGMEANGWFKCDGRNISSLSALSADEITTLTNILGGSSNLPDLRGNFLRGLDEGRGQDLDAGSRTGGESTTGVRSYQENQIKSHSHTGSTNTDGAHVHGISGSTRDDNNFAGGQPAGDAFFGNLGMATNFDGSHSHNLTTNNTGGAETRPVNIAVYWLIRGK
jgi:microcystin-dependent protein